jgi:hypothetical protein
MRLLFGGHGTRFTFPTPICCRFGAQARPVPRRTDSSHGTDGGPKIGQTWYDFRREREALLKTRFSKEELKR